MSSGVRLQGKIALITGAARGIGLGFAKAFVAEGAQVVIADINGDAAKHACEVIGEAASFVVMDVAEQESIEIAVKQVEDNFGRIDILINNAAVFDLAGITQISRESYDRLFNINVAGTLFTMQCVVKGMIDRGQGGKIINMASQAGRRGESLVGVYCATKAAVISLTQSAGLNLIEHGINVNAIAPGVVEGEHWDGVDAKFAVAEGRPLGEKKKLVGAAVPIGRMATVADLSGMAVFLASKDADYIVAQTYNVDGGNWMS